MERINRIKVVLAEKDKSNKWLADLCFPQHRWRLTYIWHCPTSLKVQKDSSKEQIGTSLT